MAQALPPLNWLRAFESAARHLNFTTAAREINLTQSAVSQHIRSLEMRLGAILFVRKARGLAITDSGRQLLASVAPALADLTKATAMFMPQRTENSLKVACSWSFSLAWLSYRHRPVYYHLFPVFGCRLSVRYGLMIINWSVPISKFDMGQKSLLAKALNYYLAMKLFPFVRLINYRIIQRLSQCIKVG